MISIYPLTPAIHPVTHIPLQLTPSHLVFWSCRQRSCCCLLMEWRNRTNMGADLKSRCGQQAPPCQHVRSRPACSQIKGSSSVEARNDNCRHILYRPPRHRLPGDRKCVNRALTIASPLLSPTPLSTRLPATKVCRLLPFTSRTDKRVWINLVRSLKQRRKDNLKRKTFRSFIFN